MCVSGLLANVDGHCHLGAVSGRWWREIAVMPTAFMWARKSVVNGVTVGVEVMLRMLVKSQTEQRSITSTGWSWLYSVVFSASVNQLHRVHKHSSPPVTVNVAVEPCLVRENHCPLVVGCCGHLCWTQPLLAGEVAPPYAEILEGSKVLEKYFMSSVRSPTSK